MNSKRKTSSIPKSFFLFLGASLFLWILTTLSQDYENTLAFPIRFENLPNDKLIQEAPPSSISIHTKGTGFKLLSESIFTPTIVLDAATISPAGGSKYYLLLQQQRLQIQKQIGSGLTVEHFLQDSVFLQLGYLSYKKVPVKSQLAIEFEVGYDFSSPVQITPDSVMVTGPESFIDTLQFIRTQKKLLKNVQGPIEEQLSLETIPQIKNTSTSSDVVTITANVEEFTEGSISVPFSIVNLPEGVVLKTFPKEVTVSYKVALSQFNNISAASFEIVCDYQQSTENSLSYLIPKVVSKSPLVKSVNIVPKRIDFIIER